VSPRPALLSCGWIVPRRNPVVLSPHWFGDPTSWFIHLVVFRRRARAVLQARDSFRGLCPRFRVLPGQPRHANRVPAALSRFASPSAQPNRDEPPLPKLPPSGLVASLPFLPASTPCSRPDLPGMFHPGAHMGFSLQSVTRRGSHSPFGAPSPLAIGQATFTPPTVCRTAARASPGTRLAPSPFGFSAWRA
jgi:hypothetical protein